MIKGTLLPVVRNDLVIRSIGNGGRYVIKNPATGRFFEVGDQEHFLLQCLVDRHSRQQICNDFEQEFGEPLSHDDLQGFIALAEKRGLLQPPESDSADDIAAPRERLPDEEAQLARRLEPGQNSPAQTSSAPTPPAPSPPAQSLAAQTAPQTASRPARRTNLLYMRWRLFDPDRLFSHLAPALGFFWSRGFVAVAVVSILLAAVIVFLNGQQLVSSFTYAWQWQTIFVVWITLLGVTLLHESAHGLTCKRFGGEVHEIGFLLLFFMPAFYCNVSDAWLFSEKRKRLWVTAAGGMFELFLWSLAVFIWRLTVQHSLVNYVAWIVLSATGTRVFFNFCPLLKLDGYYLLSDWLEIPNLRARSLAYLKGHIRSLLWGGPRPTPERRGGVLLAFGALSFCFSLCFLALILVGLGRFLHGYVGVAGPVTVAVLGLVAGRGLFSGTNAGEMTNMFRKRHVRLGCWLLAIAGLAAALFAVPFEDYAAGTFELRPANHVEVRAPVPGFLQEIHFDQGDEISCGAVVGRMYVSDLASRLEQKKAEIRETEAQLRELEAGNRPEEIQEQQQRVERAEAWHELAKLELQRASQQLKSDLERLDDELKKSRAELEFAEDAWRSAERLAKQNAIADQRHREQKKMYEVWRAEVERVGAEKAARTATGTTEAEVELARRQNEMADAKAKLRLLQAGSRAEDIESARAHLGRLRSELEFLEETQAKLVICSAQSGVVKTAHLKETVGRYLEEGDLICEIDDNRRLHVEIQVPEEQVARLAPGQSVDLKFRALPYETFSARLGRLAPHARDKDEEDSPQTNVTVFCEFENPDGLIRPGMTGYARIYCGTRSLGEIAVDRLVRVLRTEFWW